MTILTFHNKSIGVQRAAFMYNPPNRNNTLLVVVKILHFFWFVSRCMLPPSVVLKGPVMYVFGDGVDISPQSLGVVPFYFHIRVSASCICVSSSFSTGLFFWLVFACDSCIFNLFSSWDVTVCRVPRGRKMYMTGFHSWRWGTTRWREKKIIVYYVKKCCFVAVSCFCASVTLQALFLQSVWLIHKSHQIQVFS